MVAAATAVDNGATVIVLEKMAMLGGNTARSEGNMSAMDPEPEKLLPMTRAVRDIIAKYTNPKVACSPEAAELQKTVLKQLAERQEVHLRLSRALCASDDRGRQLQERRQARSHDDPQRHGRHEVA